MDLSEQSGEQWRTILQELNVWYDEHWDSGDVQIVFQRDNPLFNTFVLDYLAPSLLRGESAFQRCLDYIANEPERVLKFTYYLAASSIWNPLQAPADDVARDLLAQGWTLGSLRVHLQQVLVLPWVSDLNGGGPGAPDEPMLQ